LVPNGTTRERSERVYHPSNVLRLLDHGVEIYRSTEPCYSGRAQHTVSHGNKISLVGKTKQDIGGSFVTQKNELKSEYTLLDAFAPINSDLAWTAQGPINAWWNQKNPTADYLAPMSANDVNYYGAQAIARCIPTNPKAGLGQFLGELSSLPKGFQHEAWKDVIQSFRSKTRRFDFDKASRAAAGEYLNQVFGWMPFISDLYDTAKVINNSAKIIGDFLRSANRPVHRTYRYPIETVTSEASVVSSSFSGVPPLPSYFYDRYGVLTRTVQTTREIWFSGSFTYYLPPIIPEDNEFVQGINRWKQTEQIANRLFGTRLTPDLLYKLTPWSWAANFVSNAGDVVHNWSAFANDGLVMNYGYLMETKVSREIYALDGLVIKGHPTYAKQTLEKVTKSRFVASPFGFGVNPASFTAKQWSIIAALGISKQPLSLNSQ
jgi:hypothetical protein